MLPNSKKNDEVKTDERFGAVVKLKSGQELIRLETGELIVANHWYEEVDKMCQDGIDVVMLLKQFDDREAYIVEGVIPSKSGKEL